MDSKTQVLGAITARANDARDLADSLEHDDPISPRAQALVRQLRELSLRAGDGDPAVADAQRVLGFRADQT